MPAKAKGRNPHQQTRRARDSKGRDHPQPGGYSEKMQQHGGGVGAQTEECRMSQRNLVAESAQQIPGAADSGVEQDQGGDAQIVAFAIQHEERQEKKHGQSDSDERPWVLSIFPVSSMNLPPEKAVRSVRQRENETR